MNTLALAAAGYESHYSTAVSSPLPIASPQILWAPAHVFARFIEIWSDPIAVQNAIIIGLWVGVVAGWWLYLRFRPKP